ncbi:hypothetical protein DH2020_035908 [Rehmannia glutinosa]|uniref:Uncharacterized protein n=1 Tax=Rehmannia glutinosa TaxID=99300 RepID=A0ABR0V7P3_REHGL
MGRSNQKRHHHTTKSHTLPSSPTHSSSDFEFTISLSPRKSSAALCPADELFTKASYSPSTSLPASPWSVLSSSPLPPPPPPPTPPPPPPATPPPPIPPPPTSSVPTPPALAPPPTMNSNASLITPPPTTTSSTSDQNRKQKPAVVKRHRREARELKREGSHTQVLEKVKPLYEKLSQKQQQQQQQKTSRTPPPRAAAPPLSSGFSRSANTTFCVMKDTDHEFMKEINPNSNFPNSFSGNLRCPRRRRSCISSCPSSMMSSPRRGESGFGYTQMGRVGCNSDASSMEELQSAIQGAIAHCKNSMMKNKNLFEYEDDNSNMSDSEGDRSSSGELILALGFTA